MNVILEEILANRDEKYKAFNQKLLPSISQDTILGLRSPIAHSIGKKYANTKEGNDFLNSLPHNYYEENLVHAFILSNKKCSYEEKKEHIIKFLPYINNWGICDGFSSALKSFFKSPRQSYDFVLSLTKSPHPFTVRFGLVCLINYYICEEYIDTILSLCVELSKRDAILPIAYASDEYYIDMAIAWLMSFCLIKEYDKSIFVIKNSLLSKRIHNKSIQKSLESYQISQEKKNYLRSLKIK